MELCADPHCQGWKTQCWLPGLVMLVRWGESGCKT